MNLYHLRVFQTVAKHQHITRASEELILSQPAVTKIVQSLEHETGLELIERHGRRIVLTHAGYVLQSYAQRMFALEREMEEAMAVLHEVETGDITLAANPTSGVYLLPPIVSQYRHLYPHVTLHMSILNSHEILEQTFNWTLDFGVVEGDPDMLPSGLRVEVFAQDELMLVVAPNHRWSKQKEVHPEAVGNQELVLREQGSSIREVIEQALLRYRVQVHPLFTLTDNEAIKQMVMSGVGAAIISALAVKREVLSGDLVRIPISGVDLRPQLSVVRRRDKHLSRAAQAFVALLQSTSVSE